jgi:hypothetical protein
MTRETTHMKNELIESRDAAAFEALRWHDSRMPNIRIEATEDRGSTICLDLSMTGVPEQPAELLLHECRAVRMHLDLLGKEFCGHQLASAICRPAEESDEPFIADVDEQFDLRRDQTTDGLLLFKFRLIHPGGQMLVLAKSFTFRTLASN